jgi:hypothetical protein
MGITEMRLVLPAGTNILLRERYAHKQSCHNPSWLQNAHPLNINAKIA